MYSLNLMRIALELAQHNHVYEDIATKFFEHFPAHCGSDERYRRVRHRRCGMRRTGTLLRCAERSRGWKDSAERCRSLVGLDSTLCRGGAASTASWKSAGSSPGALRWFLQHRPDLAKLVSAWDECGRNERPSRFRSCAVTA